MLTTLVKKLFGSQNERTLRRLNKIVHKINALEPSLALLSQTELSNKTMTFKQQYQSGESLSTLLPFAFAVAREMSKRVLGLRHFDVQLIGGMVLHDGNIAEMRTGEGKTLVATLPAYLHGLTGKGVHIVTVNDYLAKRDSDWMRPLYEALGLSVGVILPNMSQKEKQDAYACDIVYGTNNEFGFDYLRDNMAFTIEDKVQRALYFAIVDEVDSILIDEARTPLIISGAMQSSADLYTAVNQFIPALKEENETNVTGDYTVDLKQKQVHLTEKGHQHVEELLKSNGLLDNNESLYHANNIILMHHVTVALKAHVIFHRDIDYIVADNQVVIVDEHTGRTMQGRRWSEGLHQAVEAKERLPIQSENQTLASITFQNFFRLYDYISGMTGTADTEAYEFQQIYGLDVVVIPTNQQMKRLDEGDLVYLTFDEKYTAIITDIKDCIQRKQPVLVGTTSIESNEFLSALLTKEKVPHQVLNAKFHEKEAEIIAEAGRPGVVTLATNMAGRGTDIELGGSLKAQLKALGDDATDAMKRQVISAWQKAHDEVLAAGGLRIIGTERHESRRIDNQLRGRAGRQGDPGSSRFYLSLDDNLMRIFTSEKVANLMRRLGMKKSEPIEHPWVSKAIENAQRKLEGHYFDVRKQLLDYDNVANDQRKVIYEQRSIIMTSNELTSVVNTFAHEVMSELMDKHMPAGTLDTEWDLKALSATLYDDFHISFYPDKLLIEHPNWDSEEVKQHLFDVVHQRYTEKSSLIGQDMMTAFVKSVILQSMDTHWREHLATMDYLRQGIHLRGYAQKDPKQEYKREAFYLFKEMIDLMKYDIVRMVLTVSLQTEEDVEAIESQRRREQAMSINYQHPSFGQLSEDPLPDNETMASTIRFDKKVGRNDPCPCGSGKKFKVCHGSLS